MLRVRLTTLICIFHIYSYAEGSEAPPTVFLQMSLEELLEVKISVTSKQKTGPLMAAGGVSWYSQKEMDQLGYHSLARLANITPGFGTVQSFGEIGLSTRGQSPGAFDNNKHLLLVDEIPIYHARSYKAPIGSELPLFFAEQVDFLRGPASSLYGVNAYHGIISIQPRKQETTGHSSFFRFEHNPSQNSMGLHAVAYGKQDDNSSFELASSSTNRAPSKSQVGEATDEHRLYWDDESSSFFRGSFSPGGTLSGLSLGVVYTDRTTSIGEFWADFSSQVNLLRFKSLIPYIKFKKRLSESIGLNSYVKYNHSQESGYWPGGIEGSIGEDSTVFASYDLSIKTVEVLSELHINLGEYSSLLVGINADSQQQIGANESYNGAFMTVSNITDAYRLQYDNGNGNLGLVNSIESSDPINSGSAYIQYQRQLDILSGLAITAGIRSTHSQTKSNSYKQTSPRLSIVQKLTPELSIKGLYGSALKAPGIKEIGLNADARAEMIRKGLSESLVANVSAETVEAEEFILMYLDKDLLASLTLFRSKTKDSLQNLPQTTTDSNGDSLTYNSFVNLGTIESDGGELELRYRVGPSFWTALNYSLSSAKTHDGLSPMDIPQGQFNGTMATQLERLEGALVYRHINRYTGAEGSYKDRSLENLDLHVKYHSQEDLKLSLQLNNVLNQEFLLPRQGVPMIPQDKRSLQLAVELRL